MHEQHRQLFDHRIDEILDRFEHKATHAIQKRNSWDDWERRVQARRAHRERMETLADREEDRWVRLLQTAANWKEAALLRDFVEGVGRRMNALNDKPGRADLWLKWARGRVSALDPFQRDARTLYEELIAKPGRGKSGPYDAGSEDLDDEECDLGD
jgi:hypothetical protein